MGDDNLSVHEARRTPTMPSKLKERISSRHILPRAQEHSTTLLEDTLSYLSLCSYGAFSFSINYLITDALLFLLHSRPFALCLFVQVFYGLMLVMVSSAIWFL
ncbi:uncharacterized protein EDB93DRAFT_1161907 [Suillus bovinus]|uniref:uncharacterized protein n=1 Tax=Suillus bovinus TaxID=48563 RepID=UPI001B87F2E6|nr:uncharacterized protein EDB93DRAFT_1161907 [Suillus bovinus]KAG2140208.1 hypothetical protein EDB93DRAFT_1161907 [Suillus bovinus]